MGIENEALYTPAVARVLADQGYLAESAKVYSHLLSRIPGHGGFREALKGIEGRLAEEHVTEEELVPLFAEWLTLLSAYGRLSQLTNLDLKRGCHGNE